MALKSFDRCLTDELALLGPIYEARRLEHPALASWPSIPSVLVVTRPRKEGKKRYVSPEGAAVLCALIDLHQRTRRRVWGAVLLGAFREMLKAVEQRLFGGTRDERRALLLSSFSEALLRVDPHRDPPRIAMYVRQETRRAVFRELRKELDWRKVGFGKDAAKCPAPPPLESLLAGHAWTGSIGGWHGVPEGVTELSATAGRGDLWAVVRKHYSGLPPKELARVYRRLQKRRHRFAGKVRQRIKGEDVALSRAFSLDDLPPAPKPRHAALPGDPPVLNCAVLSTDAPASDLLLPRDAGVTFEGDIGAAVPPALEVVS